MKKQTNIEWASHTWNPYNWKCNKVSQGCKNCYMMAFANRLNRPNPVGTPTVRERAWSELNKIPSGSVIFVNSMSDTYHEGVPIETIQRVHNTAAEYPDMTFLFLTKRIKRVYEIQDHLTWEDNIWIGTSIESNNYLWRLDYLRNIPHAGGRFISVEPLLSELNLNGYLFSRQINWVIVGGESGKGYRPFNKQWARIIRDECQEYDVPFLFKQGSAFKSGQDRMLDGRTWDETPFAEPPPPQTQPVQKSLF